MKKTFIALSLMATLGVGGMVGEVTPAKASGYSQSDIESRLREANSQISNLQNQLGTAQQQYDKLNKEINDIQTKTNEKGQQITETKLNIEKLQIQINEITERMKQRNDLLVDRARSFQESGGSISYLGVLIGSQSFSDFIDRVEAVATIVDADRNILEQHQADKETIEKSQSELKSELDSLEVMLSELKKLEEELTVKKQEQNNVIEGLKEKERMVQDELSRLEVEKAGLINNAVQSSLTNTNQQQTGSNTNNVKVDQSADKGLFIWPTIGGYISTYQGMRWGEFHKGIDIARPADNSILAAISGTVTYAGWINGYGNTIKISHDNGYSTQYAHLASINVSSGQSVSQGSKIGVMGSTGFSTGVHLDFEVYKNGRLLNPMDVLPER